LGAQNPQGCRLNGNGQRYWRPRAVDRRDKADGLPWRDGVVFPAPIPRRQVPDLRLLPGMAEKKAKRDRFVEERTRLLASVVLTRREDLTLAEPPKDGAGLGLLVDIQDPGNPGLRRFGVVLRGDVPPATEEQLNKTLKSALREVRHLRDAALPICLFYFTM